MNKKEKPFIELSNELDETFMIVGDECKIEGDKITFTYKPSKYLDKQNKPPKFHKFLKECGMDQVVDGDGVKFINKVIDTDG